MTRVYCPGCGHYHGHVRDNLTVNWGRCIAIVPGMAGGVARCSCDGLDS